MEQKKALHTTGENINNGLENELRDLSMDMSSGYESQAAQANTNFQRQHQANEKVRAEQEQQKTYEYDRELLKLRLMELSESIKEFNEVLFSGWNKREDRNKREEQIKKLFIDIVGVTTSDKKELESIGNNWSYDRFVSGSAKKREVNYFLEELKKVLINQPHDLEEKIKNVSQVNMVVQKFIPEIKILQARDSENKRLLKETKVGLLGKIKNVFRKS